MVFIPPNTTTAVFLDNYHPNFGGPGVDLRTGAHSPTSYVYPGTAESVFGTEYNLKTNTLRPLRPLSNTFCSAGAFYKDGTLVNLAGAEAVGVQQGFNKLRTYKPGPCEGECEQDWSEQSKRLQRWRWYPSAQTLVDGSVVVVGGAKAGGLVVNQARVNEPTYEIVRQDNRHPRAPVTLPILDFSKAQDLDPGRSYNLYPICEFLPSPCDVHQPKGQFFGRKRSADGFNAKCTFCPTLPEQITSSPLLGTRPLFGTIRQTSSSRLCRTHHFTREHSLRPQPQCCYLFVRRTISLISYYVAALQGICRTQRHSKTATPSMPVATPPNGQPQTTYLTDPRPCL